MSADGMQPEDVERVFWYRYDLPPEGDDHEPSDLPEVDDDTDPDWDLDDRIYLTCD